jgi:peptidoglycan/LPS O-acetylase OafA/YrhL
MIYALEGLRGIAAFIVALYHGWVSGVTDIPLITNGWVFVDLFFVISGFVMCHVYRHHLSTRVELAAFFIRRFGRLYPLHVATMVVAIAAILGRQGLKELSGRMGFSLGQHPAHFDLVDTWRVVSNLLMVHGLGFGRAYNSPAWSISTEIWTYVLFAATVFLLGRKAAIAWIVLSLTGLTVCLALKVPSLDIVDGFAFFRCVYGFFIGACIPLVNVRWRPSAMLLGASQLLALSTSTAMVWLASDYPVLTFALPFAFGWLVLSLSTDAGPVAGWLRHGLFQRLGRLSYSIYMVHAPLLVFFDPLGEGLHEPYRSGLRLLYVAVTIAFSELSYRLVEVPWRTRFQRYAQRTQANRAATALGNVSA